jgi:hypothetical protein
MSLELGPEFQTARIVHRQHVNGRSAACGETHDANPFKHEVLGPSVATRVKERHDLLAHGVDTTQARTLMEVASIAGPAKVIGGVGPAVLLGCDVFNVVGELAVSLMEQAVFAALARPCADKLPRGGVHHEAPLGARRRRAFN